MKGFKNLCPFAATRCVRAGLLGLALLSVAGITGCQVDVGGQTLPSPYYFSDDVQYFPKGPEFLLEREAAALQQAANEEAMRR
jgi:hypothetical protein